jgi:DNA repair photolyase
MRWQGQELGVADDNALPGMEQLDGLVRSVTTPEFAGVTFHEVAAKSALNHVPRSSSMPFDWTINPYRGCTHACVYCVSADTLVLRADGRQVPIRDLMLGDEIIGTKKQGTYRRYVRTTVQAKWPTRKRAHRVVLADGTELITSADHRFLTDRGWKYVRGAGSGAEQRPHLTTSNRMLGFGLAHRAPERTKHTADYRRGYLTGMIRGDGMIFHGAYAGTDRVRNIHMFRLALSESDGEALSRSRDFLSTFGIETRLRPFSPATHARQAMTAIHTARRDGVAAIERLIDLPSLRSLSWRTGFLSGIFDAEGSCSRGVLRISNKNEEILALISECLRALRVPHVVEPPAANGVRSVRVTGGLPQRQRFFDLIDAAVSRKRDISGTAVKTVADLRVVSVEDLGYDIEMVDITTGTGDFIANGVISHNCFARGTHEYLDLDAGADFDSQIVVKVNVDEVLRRELARPSWKREHVALGTNTDPYQRAEGRYRLMPGITTALAESGTPFSILTKGSLLRRDLPLLTQLHDQVPISIAMSIAVYDDALQQAIEPGTPSTQARLDTVRAAADAGFPVSVFLMPILPHLTDSADALDAALARVRAAGAARVVHGALHLRPGVKPWFMRWLAREHPELLPAYRGLYPGASVNAPQAYRTMLAQRIRPLIRAHGLDGRADGDPWRRPAEPAPARIITTSRGRAAAAATRAPEPARLF